MRKLRNYILLLLVAAVFSACTGITALSSTGESVFIGGFPAGFIINCAGAEVVGTCDVYTGEGNVSPSKEAGIRPGDLVISLNGQNVQGAADINKALSTSSGKPTNIRITRDGETYDLVITPRKDAGTGKFKIGLFVRDSMTGIGTVTYIKKDNLRFGSLGHPVLNQQGELVTITSSDVYLCSVIGVNKGLKGTPGELRGIIIKDKAIGTADKNTASGIFGCLNKNAQSCLKDSRVMQTSSSVKPGKASIFTTVTGAEAKEYEINIVKVDKNEKNNKNLVLKITDPALLSETGGIVQGMSGSPIIQGGKLVGAVTHVFVNDPTRGFGILIDKMINE